MASAVVNSGVVGRADGFLELMSGSSAGSRLKWVKGSRIGGVRERDRWERSNNNNSKQQQQSGKKVEVGVKKTYCSGVNDGSSSNNGAAGCSAGGSETDDFEFRLGDGVGGSMLSADELFADGMLVPLQMANRTATVAAEKADYAGVVDPSVLISPRAPKCSRRWKELLRFKKAAQNAKLEQVQRAAAAAAAVSTATQQQHCGKQAVAAGANGNGNSSSNLRSLRHYLHRNNGNKQLSSSDGGSLTLLRDAESSSSSLDSIYLPGRLSLSSSSSSGVDHDEVLPRLSLDSDRQPPRLVLSKSRVGRSPGRRCSGAPPPRCLSVDSPRMNSSGKVVFQNLGRSSSSPSSIGGGGAARGKGWRNSGERSYSTNMRITPVLNVPVCSLKSGSVFGLGLFSQKKATDGGRGGGGGGSNITRML